MSNGEKVVTLNSDVWGKTEDNMRYIQGILGLMMDLTCCKVDHFYNTYIPEDLHPIVAEAWNKMTEVQNAFFYGKLEEEKDGD